MMRKLLWLGVLCCLASAVANAQDEPLKRVSRGWEVNGLTLSWTLDRLAKDLASTTTLSPIILIYEGWDDDAVLVRDKDGRAHIELNEDRPRFSIRTNGKSLKEVLDEITAQDGSLVWRFDPNQRIVYLIEKHFVSAQRWRLNAPLGAVGEKELTFQQAEDLLGANFGLILDSPKRLLNYQGNPNAIVWRPGEHREKTARELMASVVKFLTYQKSINSYYEINVMPNLADPRRAFEELRNRPYITWAVFTFKINGDDTYNKSVANHKKLEEAIEVGKEAEKKATRKVPKYQYPPDGVFMWNGE